MRSIVPHELCALRAHGTHAYTHIRILRFLAAQVETFCAWTRRAVISGRVIPTTILPSGELRETFRLNICRVSDAGLLFHAGAPAQA
jgi:hypothetical protein